MIAATLLSSFGKLAAVYVRRQFEINISANTPLLTGVALSSVVGYYVRKTFYHSAHRYETRSKIRREELMESVVKELEPQFVKKRSTCYVLYKQLCNAAASKGGTSCQGLSKEPYEIRQQFLAGQDNSVFGYLSFPGLVLKQYEEAQETSPNNILDRLDDLDEVLVLKWISFMTSLKRIHVADEVGLMIALLYKLKLASAQEYQDFLLVICTRFLSKLYIEDEELFKQALKSCVVITLIDESSVQKFIKKVLDKMLFISIGRHAKFMATQLAVHKEVKASFLQYDDDEDESNN